MMCWGLWMKNTWSLCQKESKSWEGPDRNEEAWGSKTYVLSYNRWKWGHLLVLSAGRDVLPTIFVWNSGQDVQYVIVFQPSILTEFLGLKLHFFHVQKHWIFSFVLLWWRHFFVADCKEWGRKDCTACVTTCILSLHCTWLAAVAPVWARFLWPRSMLNLFFSPRTQC